MILIGTLDVEDDTNMSLQSRLLLTLVILTAVASVVHSGNVSSTVPHSREIKVNTLVIRA